MGSVGQEGCQLAGMVNLYSESRGSVGDCCKLVASWGVEARVVFDAVTTPRKSCEIGVHAVDSGTQEFEISGCAWRERSYQGRTYLGGRGAILSSTSFVMLSKKLFLGGRKAQSYRQPVFAVV